MTLVPEDSKGQKRGALRPLNVEILLEPVTDVTTKYPGINLDFADAHTIQPGFGIDIDITYIQIKKPVVIKEYVEAYLAG